jgi:hypothetical protein
VLVGVLGVAVAGAAALGATQSPSPLSSKAQSEQFHRAVERTLTSKSFTIHFAGQRIIYQAPNRTRVAEVSPGSLGIGISFVTIGSDSYAEFGSDEWQKVSSSLFGPNDPADALSYLRALSSFKTATLAGDTYTVHGVLADIPKPLETVIFTRVTHGPHGQTGSSFGLSNPNERAKVVGRVVVVGGRVTSETFTAFDAYPTRGGSGSTRTGSVSYSAFDTSPAISVPTKAELGEPSLPCTPNNEGTCQVTTTGSSPHSTFCRRVDADSRNIQAQAQLAAAQAAAQSGQWSAVRTSELALLAVLEKGARSVALPPDAPRDVVVANANEVRYLQDERAIVVRSKSVSQFKTLGSSDLLKIFGSLAVLGPYETKECGGTTTYSQGFVGQASNGAHGNL